MNGCQWGIVKNAGKGTGISGSSASEMECKAYNFDDDGSIPNSPLPLLLYPDALSKEQRQPANCRKLLKSHGWSNTWVNGIFSYHHYHSNAHEVLAVLDGQAKVLLGGAEGKQVSLSAGDVVLIPAGTGHCRLSSSSDFKVMGAYDRGKDHDLCRGKPEERPQVLENIKEVPMPEQDPVTGEQSPLYDYWPSD